LGEERTTPHHKTNSLLGNIIQGLGIGELLWTQ